MEPKEDEFEITKRSEAGQIVDALGDTALFAFRVVSLVRSDASCVLYRGAYEVGGVSDPGLGFVEKLAGPTAENFTSRTVRWETAERSKWVLTSASRYGFVVSHEGTFVFRRDTTAEELSAHLLGHLAELEEKK